MSSLVAYASSEDSDSEDGEVEEKNDLSLRSQTEEKPPEKDINVAITQPVPRIESNISTSNNEKNANFGDHNSEDSNMFRVLPTPSTKPAFSEVLPEDDLEDLVKPKKSQMTTLPKPLPLLNKQRVQITIPSLDSDSDEEEIVTKKKPKFSGSGNLLEILPPPKHMSVKQANRTLIPHTLSRKSSALNKMNVAKVQNVASRKSPATAAAKMLTDYNSDDEDEDITNGSNFFSLDTDKKTQEVTYSTPSLHMINRKSDDYSVPPLPPSNVATSTPFAQESHVDSSQQDTQVQVYPQYEMQPVNPSYQQNLFEPQPSSSDPNLSSMDDLLQDEQFLRLQGKSKRGKEQIQIMDVNTDDFIDTSELTKTLTQEMPKHSHKKKKDAPSKQSRSKHQITYLAYQAKERELELKNQWSQNKLTKRQTQAKYGF